MQCTCTARIPAAAAEHPAAARLAAGDTPGTGTRPLRARVGEGRTGTRDCPVEDRNLGAGTLREVAAAVGCTGDSDALWVHSVLLPTRCLVKSNASIQVTESMPCPAEQH